MRRLWLVFAALMALALAACGGGRSGGSGGYSFVYASSGPSSCAPCVDISLDSTTGGTTLVLRIMVKGVTNIHDAAFDLQFDTAKLNYASYSAGPLLTKNGAPAAFAVAPDGADPSILTVGAAITDSIAEVDASASGEVLLKITFTATDTGDAAFTFRNDAPYASELHDKDGNILTATWWGGMLNIS